MEKKHRCKLCFRNFANGRALGGHMRSHMMKLYAEQKASKQEEREEEAFDDLQSIHSYSSTPSSSSSSSDEEFEEEISDEVKEGLSYELRENPKKSRLLVDHELSVVLQDRESETESSKKKKAICRRSKRVRKSRVSDLDPFGFFEVKRSKWEGEGEGEGKSKVNNTENSSLSSTISDTTVTPEEHVAHCLIMLSKDKWERREEMEYEEDGGPEMKFGQEDYSQDSGVVKVIKSTKVRGKYRCEACNKLFRSYQALGGHRASHNKVKVNAPAPVRGGAAAVVVEKIHQCPFCDRVFSSGQALGGHKRSHFIGGGAISTIPTTVKQNSRNSQTNFNIDLNLPAPIEDDDNSQIAVSAVSDAEFLHPIKH